MKKIIISCLISLIYSTVIQAQSLAFFKDGVKLNNNADVYLPKVTFSFEGIKIDSKLQLKNLTSSAIGTTVKQTVIEAPSSGYIVIYIMHHLNLLIIV